MALPVHRLAFKSSSRYIEVPSQNLKIYTSFTFCRSDVIFKECDDHQISRDKMEDCWNYFNPTVFVNKQVSFLEDRHIKLVEFPADERPSYDLTTLIQHDRTPAVKEYPTGTVPLPDRNLKSNPEKKNGNSEYNQNLKKFYARRYKLFFMFDQYGIEMNDEMWFSVTPESLARHHAFRASCAITKEKMSARNLANEQTIALDPFCGTGNNIIHLSLVFDHVYGGDINHDTLKQAHNNVLRSGAKAHLYNRNFFEADYYLKADVVFLSPPWGGVDYDQTSYSLDDLTQSLGNTSLKMMMLAKTYAPNVILYLPKSTDINEIFQLASQIFNSIDIEFNFDTTRIVSLTIYLGHDLCSFKEIRQPRKELGEGTLQEKGSLKLIPHDSHHFNLRGSKIRVYENEKNEYKLNSEE